MSKVEELLNTELGDTCVPHGGVWQGIFDDVLPDGDGTLPVCSEVAEGFDNGSDPCHFVPQS